MCSCCFSHCMLFMLFGVLLNLSLSLSLIWILSLSHTLIFRLPSTHFPPFFISSIKPTFPAAHLPHAHNFLFDLKSSDEILNLYQVFFLFCNSFRPIGRIVSLNCMQIVRWSHLSISMGIVDNNGRSIDQSWKVSMTKCIENVYWSRHISSSPFKLPTFTS